MTHRLEVAAPISQSRAPEPSVGGIVRHRSPVAPAVERQVPVLYKTAGVVHRTTARLARPMDFEELVVAVVPDDAPLPTQFVAARDFPLSPKPALHELVRTFRRFRYRNAAPLPKHDFVVYDVRFQDPRNISHLLVDNIPLALHVQRALGKDLRCAFVDPGSPYREVIELFDLNPIFTSRRLGGQVAKLHGMRSFAPYDPAFAPDVPCSTLVPDAYQDFDFRKAGNPEKIFIARRGMRSLLNNDDCEAVFRRRGYEGVFLEDHSVLEQAQIMASAKRVIDTHGAGLGWLVLNPGLDSWLEIMTPHTFHHHFPVALNGRYKKYLQLIPELDESEIHLGYGNILAHKLRSFAVDPAMIEQALDELES
jgi:hypothetical protein